MCSLKSNKQLWFFFLNIIYTYDLKILNEVILFIRGITKEQLGNKEDLDKS